MVGARNSSNSNRLREIGVESGVTTYLLEDSDDFNEDWLKRVKVVGITSGASTPDELVQELINKLQAARNISVEKLFGKIENIHFKLPEELSNFNNELNV